jgi:hypothetical protein
MISFAREPMTIAELKRHMNRDLRRFATKKDLRRFATKKDLQRFATKRDLRLALATKTDKTDLRRWSIDIKRHFDVVAEGLEEKIQKVADGMAQIPAIRLHVAHHDKVLDEHETRIMALERNDLT